jgi:hypothetical protein
VKADDSDDSDDSDGSNEVEVSRTDAETTQATVGGEAIGEVDDLLWEDASGAYVVSVTIADSRIAVPVDRAEWRRGGDIELDFSYETLVGAPRIRDLSSAHGPNAVELLAEYFAINLTGPPPGPSPIPLPPWWKNLE